MAEEAGAAFEGNYKLLLARVKGMRVFTHGRVETKGWKIHEGWSRNTQSSKQHIAFDLAISLLEG